MSSNLYMASLTKIKERKLYMVNLIYLVESNYTVITSHVRFTFTNQIFLCTFLN